MCYFQSPRDINSVNAGRSCGITFGRCAVRLKPNRLHTTYIYPPLVGLIFCLLKVEAELRRLVIQLLPPPPRDRKQPRWCNGSTSAGRQSSYGEPFGDSSYPGSNPGLGDCSPFASEMA